MLYYLVLFHNYFWPRPRPHSPGLGLVVFASFNIIDYISDRFDISQLLIRHNQQTSAGYKS